MKQKHERKVTRFLITMAVALLVGGICGYLGAMYASSFSGVLAGWAWCWLCRACAGGACQSASAA